MYQERIVNFLKFLADSIFPPICVSCKLSLRDSNTLCGACWEKVTFIKPPFCNSCGIPYLLEIFEGKCPSCENDEFAFDTVRSAVRYEEIAQRIIHDLKYKANTNAVKFIIAQLLQSLEGLKDSIDLITCVPMHKVKLKKRGFNQAALISKKLASSLSKQYIPDLLLKKIDNLSQSGLSKRDRRLNVQNAFIMNRGFIESIKGKNIAIVDDVITTGSTLNECAVVLKSAGAGKVFAVSFARAF